MLHDLHKPYLGSTVSQPQRSPIERAAIPQSRTFRPSQCRFVGAGQNNVNLQRTRKNKNLANLTERVSVATSALIGNRGRPPYRGILPQCSECVRQQAGQVCHREGRNEDMRISNICSSTSLLEGETTSDGSPISLSCSVRQAGPEKKQQAQQPRFIYFIYLIIVWATHDAS